MTSRRVGVLAQEISLRSLCLRGAFFFTTKARRSRRGKEKEPRKKGKEPRQKSQGKRAKEKGKSEK